MECETMSMKNEEKGLKQSLTIQLTRTDRRGKMDAFEYTTGAAEKHWFPCGCEFMLCWCLEFILDRGMPRREDQMFRFWHLCLPGIDHAGGDSET